MPTTRFLFWNLNRKPLAVVVAELAEEHQVDVVILAETDGDVGRILTALNTIGDSDFHLPLGLCPTITIFTRFSRDFLVPVQESKRISIRRLALPARPDVLLASVNLPSKLHQRTESQHFECTRLAEDIAHEEDLLGHQRTILVGDFNMNPFEYGLVAAGGLNSAMSRNVAGRSFRAVKGRDYRFFYNPMWGHLGDSRGHTTGTYFYDAGEHVTCSIVRSGLDSAPTDRGL